MQIPSDVDIPSNSSQGRVAAFGIIDEELGRVREMIAKQLSDVDEFVGKLLDTFAASSGKMLRPGLVLLSASACGKITHEHIRVAAILEMIHNATLLHDDVIDQGQKRRSRPTINSLWGNESAVLLGDLLLSRVFSLCADLQPRIIGVIADAAARTCEGELRQISHTKDCDAMAESLSEAEYIDIITEKSAVLFSSACLLGGLLAGADEVQSRSLDDFGLNVGIAFQIIDDLLDIVGDESKLGKTLGSDVDKTKLTLAVIHLLKTVDAGEKGQVLEKLNTPGQNKEALTEMLSSCGSLEYACRRAERFTAEAIRALAAFEKSQATDALIETAEFMAGKGRIPHP